MCTTREQLGAEGEICFASPTSIQNVFIWKKRPCTVLLIKKLGDELIPHLVEMALWLHEEGYNVIVELSDYEDLVNMLPFLYTFEPSDELDLARMVDVVVCLGGDGVILHAASLFPLASPPLISFSLGSLGFLTTFDFEDFRQDLSRVLTVNETVYVTLRLRLHAQVLRNGVPIEGKSYNVLNEVWICCSSFVGFMAHRLNSLLRVWFVFAGCN